MLSQARHRPDKSLNHYPVYSLVDFANTYPLDSDLSGGWRYPPFEQLGHESHSFEYKAVC